MVRSPRGRLTATLNAHSFFSAGRGVSSPTRLARTAAELGYAYLALTDHLSVGGAVELTRAAKRHGITPVIGATLPIHHEGATYPLVLLTADRQGYRSINTLITLALEQQDEAVTLPALQAHASGMFALTGGRRGFLTRLLSRRRKGEALNLLQLIKDTFKDRLFVQLYHNSDPWDARRTRALRELAREHNIRVCAAPEVRYASCELYPLYDAVTCGRLGITLREPHVERPRNDAQYLQPPGKAAERLPYPEALANAERIARECSWELLPDRLTPPPARMPEGMTPDAYLEARCFEALQERYQRTEHFDAARHRLEEELATIKALGMANFFLLAAEVTDYCRSQGIVAAGRGSAAASVVCYLLGVTLADPIRHNLLFERFLHTGRSSPPDIDIDIASHRREDVLAWMEARFPKGFEAMVSNRITYHLPSAIQDLGRALGIPPDTRNQLTRALGRNYRHHRPADAREAGEVFDEILGDAPVKELLLGLLERIERGHFRHHAPHSGGTVASAKELAHYTPLFRSTGGILSTQFDKDDSEALGLAKLDLLGLRMLGTIERCREHIHHTEGVWIDLADLPDDAEVWRQIQVGDTMGLFQIESPAQMRMSVLLKAQTLEDLKIQVALVRPGPIQSGSVHPLVRRHRGSEPVTFAHEALRPILAHTYGVLLYQEDIMRIGVHLAGFNWVEAERFRKNVTTFESEEEIAGEKEAFFRAARRTVGATDEQLDAIWEAMSSFRGYGFAESHAAVFGMHTYTSAWLRSNYPAEYFAALLTEHPGMWSRQTLRQELRRWRVPLLPLDINRSHPDYRVERQANTVKAIRPALTSASGLSLKRAQEIALDRFEGGPYQGLEDYYQRVPTDGRLLSALVRAGAFDALEGAHRRATYYKAKALLNTRPPDAAPLLEGLGDIPDLTPMTLKQTVHTDHESKGFSEHDLHLMDFYRQELRAIGITPLPTLRRFVGRRVRTAGLFAQLQKPPTAKGAAFIMIEDGPVRVQVVTPPEVWQRCWKELRHATILVVEGRVDRLGMHASVQAERFWNLASRQPHSGRPAKPLRVPM